MNILIVGPVYSYPRLMPDLFDKLSGDTLYFTDPMSRHFANRYMRPDIYVRFVSTFDGIPKASTLHIIHPAIVIMMQEKYEVQTMCSYADFIRVTPDSDHAKVLAEFSLAYDHNKTKEEKKHA